HDGQYVLSGAANGSVILWNIQTGEQLRHVDVATVDFVNVAFSPDGQNALISGDLRLWRLTPSLDELMTWTYANRYVPELTCDQRELYHFDPTCSVSGVFPSRTPFQASAQNMTPTSAGNNTLTVSEVTDTPGPSATAITFTPSAVPVRAQTVKLGV